MAIIGNHGPPLRPTSLLFSRAKANARSPTAPASLQLADVASIIFAVDDVLHVRLQTLGVTEHSFDIDFGGGRYNWLLYDVGGAVRTLSLLSDGSEAR